MIRLIDERDENALKNVTCYQISMCPRTLTKAVGTDVHAYPLMVGDKETARWLTRKTLVFFYKDNLTALGYDDITFRFHTDSVDEAVALFCSINRCLFKHWDKTADTDWAARCAEISRVTHDADGMYSGEIEIVVNY